MSGDASKVENMAGAATDLASSVALTNDEPTNGVLSAANGRGGQRAKRLEDFPGNDVGKAGQDESASTPNYGRPIDVQALLAGNTSLSIPLTVPTDGGPDPLQRDPEPEEPEPLPEWAQDHVLPPPKDKLQLAPNVGAIEQGRLMRAHDADASAPSAAPGLYAHHLSTSMCPSSAPHLGRNSYAPSGGVCEIIGMMPYPDGGYFHVTNGMGSIAPVGNQGAMYNPSSMYSAPGAILAHPPQPHSAPIQSAPLQAAAVQTSQEQHASAPSFAPSAGAVVSQKQDDAVTTKCIFDYESVGVVFVTGPIPQLAIYDNAESLKLVISTFNLECQLDENDQGFSLRLRTNEEKRAAAAVFQSSLGQSTLESRIDVAVLADRFDLQRVEVKETRTRVKVLLPKRVLTRININRVRGD